MRPTIPDGLRRPQGMTDFHRPARNAGHSPNSPCRPWASIRPAGNSVRPQPTCLDDAQASCQPASAVADHEQSAQVWSCETAQMAAPRLTSGRWCFRSGQRSPGHPFQDRRPPCAGGSASAIPAFQPRNAGTQSSMSCPHPAVRPRRIRSCGPATANASDRFSRAPGRSPCSST